MFAVTTSKLFLHDSVRFSTAKREQVTFSPYRFEGFVFLFGFRNLSCNAELKSDFFVLFLKTASVESFLLSDKEREWDGYMKA